LRHSVEWLHLTLGGFGVSTNTVWVTWETVLQVKRPNQQCQSSEEKTI